MLPIASEMHGSIFREMASLACCRVDWSAGLGATLSTLPKVSDKLLLFVSFKTGQWVLIAACGCDNKVLSVMLCLTENAAWHRIKPIIIRIVM